MYIMGLFSKKPGGTWFGNLIRKFTGGTLDDPAEARNDYGGSVNKAADIIKRWSGIGTFIQ